MKVYKVLVAVTIPIFILMLFASILTTKQYLFISKGLYQSHDSITFDHDVASDRIMGYLNYRYDELQYQFEDNTNAFNQEEIEHMVDVKNLYTNLRIAAVLSLLIGVTASILIYRKDKRSLYDTYKSIYLWPIFFVLFVGGYILIDFGAAFTMFHKLFFTNDKWELDPSDTLIQLLPSNFWMVSGLFILLFFSGTLAIISIYATKKARMYH